MLQVALANRPCQRAGQIGRWPSTLAEMLPITPTVQKLMGAACRIRAYVKHSRQRGVLVFTALVKPRRAHETAGLSGSLADKTLRRGP